MYFDLYNNIIEKYNFSSRAQKSGKIIFVKLFLGIFDAPY